MTDDDKFATTNTKTKDRYKSTLRVKDAPVPEVKLAPKVLETWLNETLTEAEYLDIPGVIMKPENKAPINRY